MPLQLADTPRVDEDQEQARPEVAELVPAGVWTRQLESRLARAEERNEEWGRWFDRLRASPLFRLLVACGLWRWRQEEGMELQRSEGIEWHHFPAPQTADRLEFQRSHQPSSGGAVAIDLSSLLPGAENGGAKTVALAVVKELARARPDEKFLVLTNEACASELAGLEQANVELVEMPERVDRTFERLVDEHAIKALLCPMTLSNWIDPRVPLVCVVHDLQHRFLPWFFDAAERAGRERALERVATTADEVICVSASTRRHLVASARQLGVADTQGAMAPERVTVVHNRITGRLPELSDEEVREELACLGVEEGGYVFYPANFWPHKNHQALLHGFSLFRAAHRDSSLRLVFTGAQRPDPAQVLEAIRRLDLESRVRYLGFVDERQLSALYRGGRALVFPSLFEGFGMPLVEAMANGLPVFASELDVHQEVTRGDAYLFDPRSAQALHSVFESIESDAELLDRLRDRGLAQARRLGDTRAMGEDYWRVLERAASRPHRGAEIHGRYPDGWTAERFLITHSGRCVLVIELCNPREQSVTVCFEGGSQVGEIVVPSEKAVRLHCDLLDSGGWIEGRVTPALLPGNADGDVRSLGVMMRRCFQCLENGAVLDLLAEAR